MITLGSDPELHLCDARTGFPVSSMKVINRTKHNPLMIGKDVRMYADNVLTEFAFPPSNSVDQFMARMRRVFVAADHKIGDTYRLTAKAAMVYPEAELGPKPAVMEGELPFEWEIGCNPSIDVYQRIKKTPSPFEDGLRTGSFHVHVGDERLDTMDAKCKAIKMLDVFVGCSAVIFENDDTANVRRKLYGRAGDFRDTPYGIEYRTLGNWALNSPETTKLIMDLVVFTMNCYDYADPIMKKVNFHLVQEAINTNNRMLASSIIEKAALPYELAKRVRKNYGNPDLYKSWAL